eukprot:Skav221563  [mRNA]  locus=scaffold1376:363158:365053:- [translate_table: standard]
MALSTTSFYDVLGVGSAATLDEIKLAFKRRALQVHPDKGGNKEAFHLVYQALETLADPAARKRYDCQRVQGNPRDEAPVCTRKSKGKAKRAAPGHRQSKAASTSATAKPQSKQTKLLVKLRDLLKQLPREVRNDVFTHQFSQKQRILLENWMREQPHQSSSCWPVLRAGGENSPEHQGVVVKGRKSEASFASTALPLGHDECPAVAVGSMVRWSGLVARRKRRKKADSRKQVKRAHGKVIGVGNGYRQGNHSTHYRADIIFDGLHVYTSCTDFQTALDYLMVLTFVRQKMQDLAKKSASFEERFKETLASCAMAHGLDIADLNLSFSVHQSCTFFVGPEMKVRTPMVKDIEQLGKMRRCLESFRQYSRHTGSNSLYSLYSPAHLADAWERLQDAVADAWKVAKSDSTKFLQKMRLQHEASAYLRFRALQHCERRKMAANDKNQYRPQSLQEPSSRPSERKERQKMATHDKNQHRPRRLQERSSGYIERRERQNMAAHDKNQHRPRGLQDSTFVAQQLMSRRMLTLKLLLVRWERMLTWQQKQEHARRQTLGSVEAETDARRRAIEERNPEMQTKEDKEVQWFHGEPPVDLILRCWYLFVPFASHQKVCSPTTRVLFCRTLGHAHNRGDSRP